MYFEGRSYHEPWVLRKSDLRTRGIDSSDQFVSSQVVSINDRLHRPELVKALVAYCTTVAFLI